ncbi:MAG: hypothetical protein AAFY52_05900 [Pseudomonadota bacterium]
MSVIASLATQSQAREACTLRNNYCVPFVACTEDGAKYFVGNSLGKDEGPVRAKSADGTVCEGRWWRTQIGTGKVKFSCTDGVTGSARYAYFHKGSGTATGRGRTDQGDKMRFWSGHRISEFLLSEANKDDLELLRCAARAIESKPVS